MRIIGGTAGGRRFNPPAKMPYTRPTTDIAKEGLFNIIENNLDITALKTLDLFGGTGSISYELASRGAKTLTVVEKDPKMHAFITRHMEAFGFEHMQIVKMDVFAFLLQCNEQFDFIFAGPPYALGNIDDLPVEVFKRNLLLRKGWFVLEHTPRNNYEKHPYFKTARHYGTTVFSIFVNNEI
ncbi:RsmD family RNA methyltransferase [Agriterribacter sp.]|uniref:RsmD family RNA methyltransferase n=1 Tax=Agriterribacter sp. TaxID=2821509 RepID=UPI002CC2788B|nr:RsmD family RNA methyltransferase [Agriterribacter sp.]HTN06479.1 RsmD family RNA methyltransferase [Agriterribacter sp.]